MKAIAKPRADKLPKTQVDSIKIMVTDGDTHEEETLSVFQETSKTVASKMQLDKSFVGGLGKTASTFKADREAKEIDREKTKSGQNKSGTVEFGGLKLPDNE